MAGIYIHIPFCKSRCVYCDFYSTTRGTLKTSYVQALCHELAMRKDYLDQPVETLYFGGGTPSLLAEADWRQIFTTLQAEYGLEHCQEITLEANPDDLTPTYLEMLTRFPFNRISIGIQTFDDATLRVLNRRHDARTAIDAVRRCEEAGFRHISIDLMYGLPGETEERWAADLRQAIDLRVEHISAYHLIYEEGTPLYRLLQQHRVEEVGEDSSLRFFTMLIDTLHAAGYEHYEISNFCLPGRYSRHNTSYWQGIPYLGCGTAAHSFNGSSREWNVSDIDLYIKGIETGERVFETETLNPTIRYNEFIITTMRTRWGTPLAKLKEDFGEGRLEYCLRMAEPYVQAGKLEERDGALCLTRAGIFVSDSIMSDLLWVD
ncbi:MAG: radical SAM family heme chaperone HemW [Mediterranea sp.]|nr:radical SAM family heme chaperone HemW [Mediterranea sp.]